MANAETPKRKRRWPWVIGGIVGFVFLLIGAVLFLLSSAVDRAVLVRGVLDIVNDQFQGKIVLQKAWLFPDGHFIAHEVAIRGPDGDVIIRAASVETHIDLPALAKKRLHLTGTTVNGAALFLATDAKGQLNIVQAFSPKHPKTEPAKPAAPSQNGFAIDIADAEVSLEEGRFVTDGEVASPLAELRDAQLRASFALTPTAAIQVKVAKLQGAVLAPVAGPLDLVATLGIDGVRLKGAAEVALADAHLEAQTSLDLSSLSGDGSITDAVLGPRFLSTYVPTLEPKGARLDAAVKLERRTLQLVALHLRPLEGEGDLTASGKLNLGTGEGDVRLDAQRFNTRAVLGRLPLTTLGIEVTAHGENVFGETRSLSAHLLVNASVVQGQPVGPGVADVAFTGGTLAFKNFNLAFPGGRARGSGKVSGKVIVANAQIDAPDLGALRAALEGMSDVNLPDFSGRLSCKLDISGPLLAPAVRADVDAPRVSLNGLEADSLVAHLNAARLAKAMDLQGAVTIAAFHFADRTLHDIGISIGWTTPDLHLDVQAKEEGRALVVSADLVLPKDLETATLSALTLQAAGSDWTLAQPAQLDFRNGVSLKGVELWSEPQRLAVSLTVSPHDLSGMVEIEALDLSRLPRALLPTLKLAGVIEGQAHYEEKDGKRAASADLTLSKVAVSGLSVPSGHLVAALDGQQVTATLSAQFGHGSVRLNAAGPLPNTAGAIAANLVVQDLVLDDFTGVLPAVSGTHANLSLALHLSGTWAAPVLALSLAATEVSGAWSTDPEAGVLAEPLNVGLTLALNAKGLSEDLKIQAGQAELLTLAGSTPLASRKFFDDLETPSKLVPLILALPLDERLVLAALPLQPVMHLVAPNTRLAGTLSAEGSIRGTVHAPRGELTVTGQSLALEGRTLGSLSLHLAAADQGFTGQVDLRPPTGALTANLDWGVAPEQVFRPSARAAARITGDVHLSALPLATGLGEQSALQGIVDMTGSLHGSLGNPAAALQVSVHDLTLEKVPSGEVNLQAKWNGKQLVASVEGEQPNGGRLEGQAELPLTMQGLLPHQPLTAKLDASGFDLAPFGAIAASGGTLRSIAGHLDAHLELGGSLAAPEPSGTLGFSGGKLALAGLGQFDDLEAQLSVDRDGLVIQSVAGKSAGGHFDIQGAIRRAAEGAFGVDAHIASKRFGVYVSDRLLGYLTSDEQLTGTVGRQGTDLKLAVSSAVFNLPQLVPKTAGPTSLDSDIVFGKRASSVVKSAAVAAGPKPYAILLNVIAPSIQLKATDLDIQAHAALTLLIQGQALMKGGVYATSGEVNAYGRSFKLDHANVTFGHGGEFGPAGEPDIDARATQTIGKYKLFVDVSGRPSDLKIVPSSDPPLDKEQVGLLLVTGSAEGVESGATGGTNQGGTVAAASALGGVVTEKLRESLGPYMPLDVLTFEPNHLEAGKHITKRLYVGVIENPGATDPRVNGTEIHANYKLTQHWSLDSRYGTAQAGDFDLQWTRSW